MKLDSRRVAAFLQSPGPCRVVLLHGEDAGLIRDRAESLTRAIVGTLEDPFRLVELDRDSLGRLEEEALALSLTGGRRVVRVRNATDAAAAAVKSLLAGKAEALVILEGPDLASRSKLRTLVEAAQDGAAIGCYRDEGPGLEDMIQRALGGLGVTIDPEAVAWLASQAGGDRGTTSRELEKLATYAGPGGHVDLAAATACAGDLAGLSLEDALFAATAGDVATADRALELALAEGSTPVGALRAALTHVQRMHRLRLAMMTEGKTAAEATRSARPPIFFRRAVATTRALEHWGGGALLAVLDRLTEAERACKRTAAPADALCRHAVLALAREAAARRSRSTARLEGR